MDNIILYTDGACSGNPGPGGWGAVLIFNGIEKELSGANPNTTNNVMEITAVIEGLKALKRPCNVNIYSDSFEKNWINNWIKNNWVNSKKEPVKNKELWLELYNLTKIHKVTFNKVKGHSNVKYNNRCDELARNAILTIQK